MPNYFAAGLYGFALVVSLAVVRRSWTARSRPGATWLSVTMVGVSWWSLLSILMALRDGPTDAFHLLLSRLEWLGIDLIAVGVLALGLVLGGRGEYLTRRRLAVLSVIPVVSMPQALADPRIAGLLADAFGPLGPLSGVLAALSNAWSVGYWINFGFVYLLLLVGTALVVEAAFERPRYHPGRVLFLLMVVVPWTINVLYNAGVVAFGGLDPTPLGFTVTGVAGIAAVGRFRLFDVPMARAGVVERLDTAVLVFGRDCRLYDYNEEAAALLGAGPDDLGASVRRVLVGRVDVTGCPPGDAAALADCLDGREVSLEAETGDEPPGHAAADVPPDDAGSRRFLLQVSTLGRGDRRELGYVVQFAEITEQHRQRNQLQATSERLRRKNDQLERLAGIVSHDLETPLATGETLLELLRADIEDPDPEVEQSLSDLQRVHDRLAEFAEHLPRLARESTDVESPEDCDLAAVVADAWEVVDTGDLALEIESSRTLRADPSRLQQALENLFGNVVEHGVRRFDPGAAGGPDHGPDAPDSVAAVREAGEPAGTAMAGSDPAPARATVVRVGTFERTGPDGEATTGFYVEDDGPGLPEGVRENAFEFGVSGRNGTGFGLAIVRVIVEAHGWSVRATDGEAGGARIEVDLEG